MESQAGTSTMTSSSHVDNIAMLFEKIRELRMSSETVADSTIFGKLESVYI